MYNPEELVGITLSDRYFVLDKIGRGGMAMVYKAHDKVLDRDVAIKILRETFDGGNTIVENFIKEARSSASLVHSNVVSVYDVCEFEGLNYMVMELVDGKTLKEYIKHKQRLPWQEACDYAIQIGQGIQAAHERNIIHRDIKPQNIIMAPGGILKVTDFGIAKAMESDKSIAGGTAMGSVHYISPEQARGGFTDFRSDIYSLGVVLYEMLAGRVPFDGDSPVSVAIMHIEEEPVNVKCVNMDVPADLAYVTMKAMSRDQSDRYQNMQEFLEDLRAVLADENLPSKEKGNINDAVLDDENIKESKSNAEIISEAENRKRVKKKTKDIIKKKREDRNAVIFALSTVVALILIIIGVVIFTTKPFPKTVPNFAGLTYKEAQQLAEDSGYKVVEYERTFSDDVERNCVVSQIPKEGTKMSRNQPVKLIISKGESHGNIAVPKIDKFSSLDEAESYLSEVGLKISWCEEYSDTVAEREFIRQLPLAGTKLKVGDEVKIYVSIGREHGTPTAVKPVTETTADNAADAAATPELESVVTPEPIINEIITEVTEEPTQIPALNDTNNVETETNNIQTRFYTVKIPDAVGDQVHVKIIANGEEVHNELHSKTDGSVTVQIPGEGDVSIQAYIDGNLMMDKTLTF